jgi:tetratricopeptide (TPR) repeat protein
MAAAAGAGAGQVLECKQTLKDVLSTAADLYKRGKSSEAASLLSSKLKAFPDSSVLHFRLAWVLHKRHQFEEATEHALESLRLEPRAYNARMLFVCIMMEVGVFEYAENSIQELLDQDPKRCATEDIAHGLVDAQADAKPVLMAIKAAQKQLDRCVGLYDKHHYSECAAEAAVMLKGYPHAAKVRQLKASAEMSIGEFGTALSTLCAAPRWESSFSSLKARALLWTDDFKGALSAAEAGLRSDPESLGCAEVRTTAVLLCRLFDEGVASMSRGNYGLAGDKLSQLYGLLPEKMTSSRARIMSHMGWAFHMGGQSATALPLLQKSVEIMPTCKTLMRIARVHEKLDDLPEALRALQKARGLDATDREVVREIERIREMIERKESKIKLPHEVLGISSTASPDEVKKAYRRLAILWHPDKVPADKKAEAQEKFKEINGAYEAMRNGTAPCEDDD